MRKAPNQAIEPFRMKGMSLPADGNNGMFAIPMPGSFYAQVICSDGLGWDHVSVCMRSKTDPNKFQTPHWDEMCYIKSLFFENEERAMQIHPRKSEYVNVHNHVLHLWRPQTGDIPMPPMEMV